METKKRKVRKLEATNFDVVGPPWLMRLVVLKRLSGPCINVVVLLSWLSCRGGLDGISGKDGEVDGGGGRGRGSRKYEYEG